MSTACGWRLSWCLLTIKTHTSFSNQDVWLSCDTSGALQSDTVALTRHESEQPQSLQLPNEWAWMAVQAVIVCLCNNRVRQPTPPGGAAEIRWRWRSSPSQTCSAQLSVETLSPALENNRARCFCALWQPHLTFFLQILVCRGRETLL